jgi:2-polyprenyl-3-methyl-5-hydroxy-6-metoxy-1,4-benzoquinol methylase
VLELGCGEGLLQQRIAPDDYLTWLGVDISEVTIDRAQTYATERVAYRTGDMEHLELAEKFDAIIFSESLSYLENRDRILERYGRWLSPDGIFIISIFNAKESPAIWEEIHRAARPFDAIKSANEVGSWLCEALRPQETVAA